MKMAKRQTVTAVIAALNEEKNIERCLESVTWCDKIQVLWMGSDKTGEIAQKYPAEVVVRGRSESSNWIQVQKNINWAIDNATTDWILRIDADEEVTPELKEEILEILSSARVRPLYGGEGVVAYGIPRNQFFFGGVLRGGDWAYDRLVRLFRPKFARYDHFVHNHEQLKVEGRVGYLKNRLNHYSHPNLASAMEKFNSYTSTEIYDLSDSRQSAFFKLFTQPPYIFLRWMIWHKGYRDGLRGVVAGAFRAWYTFLLYAKYLEMLNSRKAKRG